MAQDTPTSISYFQQLRNRQNDLYRKNTAAIRAAAKASDLNSVRKLRRERAKMVENDKRIFDAELKFQSSRLGQSEAERNLRQHVREVNNFVKTVHSVSDVLRSTAKVASILARLISILS